jgi:hypothetical protein
MGFFGSLFGKDGADAAREASGMQYLNQTKAAGDVHLAGLGYEKGMRENAQAYDPYVSAGNSALERLMAGLGLGGDQAAFTSAYRGLPGYQSGMDAGVSALDRSAASRGMTNSGAQLKALSRFGSDYEDRRVGDYLNRLASMGQQGLGATGSQVGTISQGLGGKLGTDTASAQMMYGAANTIPQGIIAAQNSHNAGAQNAVNIGTDILGKLMSGFTGMPTGGGGGSSFGSMGSNPTKLGSLY